MAADAARLYRTLPADERQEFRLPALLKEHLARASAQLGKTLAEYINDALAEKVTQDLAQSTDWSLSVDEQEALLRILLRGPDAPSKRARAAAERADSLFGPLPGRAAK